MTKKKINSIDRTALTPNYAPAWFTPVKGKKSILWDEEGNDYVDFGGGIAVTCLGHSHPELIKVLKDQSTKLWHVSNYLYNEPALELSSLLAKKTFADKVFFSNSGNEANEAAIKLARRYFYDKGKPEKYEVVVFTDAFHGRSMLNISAGDSKPQKTGFGPLLKGFKRAKFNDLKSVEKVITKNTAAIFVEPILGESGIIRASNPFLMGLRKLADKNNILLIFDEVQSGIGRTGTLMAYMGYGVVPDISTLAKGLGGGIPIGATLAKNHIAKAFQPGTHGSTFGGNPLACIVAKKVIEIISSRKVLSGVMKKTISFTKKLNLLSEKYDIFSDIRSAGLWIGCDFKKVKSSDFIQAAYNEGLIVVQAAGEKTIRLAPSLIISDKEINEGFKRFEKAYKNII
jgi:predicted acetylornithine/succinylornithine family transaminase|tara:strand:+ start:60 stop:1259 length:1200 start_codon:yes stop_codon:yes gene_type:complete